LAHAGGVLYGTELGWVTLKESWFDRFVLQLNTQHTREDSAPGPGCQCPDTGGGVTVLSGCALWLRARGAGATASRSELQGSRRARHTFLTPLPQLPWAICVFACSVLLLPHFSAPIVLHCLAPSPLLCPNSVLLPDRPRHLNTHTILHAQHQLT